MEHPRWICVAALVAQLAMGAAQGMPLVSPAAGSDAVLAQRRPQAELQLVYRVARANAPEERVQFGLSIDYHYRQSPSGLSIDDFRLKRIFQVDSGGQFRNDSLYAAAWYRQAELDNRTQINATLDKAGVKPEAGLPAQKPFWAESELGLVTPRMARPDIRRQFTHGRTRWSVDGEEIVAVIYRDEVVPAQFGQGLRRWWPSVAPIHPAIADELAASGKIPAELWVKELVYGKDFVTSHWTLTESRVVAAAAYPLPEHLNAVPADSRGAFPQLFHSASNTVAEKRGPESHALYVERINAAIARSQGLEALLWLIEMQLAEGGSAACPAGSDAEHCQLSARVGPLAKQDPRTAIAFAAHSPDAVDRVQFEGLANIHMLHVLWANRPPGNGVTRGDSERDLLAALQARPIANFCKDAGDFYVHGWSVFAGWQIYDLGRLMANHQKDDLLASVDQIEISLESGLPTLF